MRFRAGARDAASGCACEASVVEQFGPHAPGALDLLLVPPVLLSGFPTTPGTSRPAASIMAMTATSPPFST